MKISEHIENTIERWRIKWGGILGSFLASVVTGGSEKLLEKLEKEAEPGARDFVTRFPIHPIVKAELEAFLAKRSAVHMPAFAVMAIGVVIGSLIGTFMGWATPVANWTRYVGDKLIKSFRLDPAAVITAWRRDPAKYEKFFEDLREQGWNDERIEAFKFYSLFIPTADEQTHWLAREVYEPEMVARYGLDSELPNYEDTDFSKVGVTPEQMKNKWAAHWEHASYMQIREMLRRGVLSLDKTMPSPPTTEAGWDTRDAEGMKAMYDWYRLVEIPPFWRDRLTEMAFAIPTRVDVRRFWDMRTIDEERLRSIYHAQGYHGKDLDDYVLWTKVYVAFPDLIARFKNGWITEDDVRSELTGLGMPSDRVEEMIQTKIKTVAPERVAAEKTATATEIMKAVKKDMISWSEGIERLGRMGYGAEEADFKLTVYVGVVEGSPETYMEFVEWTEKYRKAMGLDAQIPPGDLVEAGKVMKQAEIALRDAESQKKEGEELAPYLKALSDAKYRYRTLLVSWEEEKKKSL